LDRLFGEEFLVDHRRGTNLLTIWAVMRISIRWLRIRRRSYQRR
jgi:hypothetical protein